jgi:hypothetical protein
LVDAGGHGRSDEQSDEANGRARHHVILQG